MSAPFVMIYKYKIYRELKGKLDMPPVHPASGHGAKRAWPAAVGLTLVVTIIAGFAGHIVSAVDTATGGIVSGLALEPGADSVPSVIKVTGKGGDMEAVYTRFRAALDAGDTKTMRSLMSAEGRDKLDSPLSSLGVRAMRAMVPKQVTVISANIYDDWGSLVLESEKDGGFISGTAKFVKEGGEYKMLTEEWKSYVQGSSRTDGSARFSEGEVAEPTEPISSELLTSQGRAGKKVWPSIFYNAEDKPRLLSTIPGCGGAVSGLFFVPGGTVVIYYCLSDGIVRLCDISTESEIDRFEPDNQPTDIILTPDGDSVVIVDSAGGLTFLAVRADGFGNSTYIAAGLGNECRLAASPNGRLLAATGDEGITLWDINKGCRLSRIETSEPVNAVTFTPNGHNLAAGSGSNSLTLWNLSTGQGRIYTVPTVGEASGISSISISNYIPTSHEDPYLVTGHMDSSIVIWDFLEMKELNNINISAGPVLDVKFSPDGKSFASSHLNGDIYLWTPESDEKMMVLSGQSNYRNPVAFSNEGNEMAYVDESGNICIMGSTPSSN